MRTRKCLGRGEWYLLDTPPSVGIDVCSSMQADLAVVLGKGDDYLIYTPTSAADVFRLVLCALNTLEKHGGYWCT